MGLLFGTEKKGWTLFSVVVVRASSRPIEWDSLPNSSADDGEVYKIPLLLPQEMALGRARVLQVFRG